MSGILVIAEHRQGQLRSITLEIIAAAQKLKQANGAPIAVAVLASDPAAFVAALSVDGVDEIITVQAESGEFDPHALQATLTALYAARQPSVILMAHSVDSWAVAPAFAAATGIGFATDVFDLAMEGGELIATRAGYKEKVFVELDFPGKETVLLTLRANIFKPAEGISTPAVTAFEAPKASTTTTHLGWKEPASAGGIDIPGSEFILSIGRGVGDEANVEQFLELADTLGATLGCSRPIADNGWLPKARQVGQSGKLAANCKLYVAMGISGSVQHQWGMKHVETIIAVNKDPDASIFRVAKYGVVGDMFEIAEELKALAEG
jgi:electron transfer flavoprotein alpha subunit